MSPRSRSGDAPVGGSDRPDRRAVRRLQRDLVAALRDDLYKSAKLRDDADPTCDGEWESPLGWRVRLRRLDLRGITENGTDGILPPPTGPMQIDVTVFQPDGEVYEFAENVIDESELDALIP